MLALFESLDNALQHRIFKNWAEVRKYPVQLVVSITLNSQWKKLNYIQFIIERKSNAYLINIWL